jgi:hypothetical protein
MQQRLCTSLASSKEKLAQLIHARAVYWKQRGKFRVVREGDENTKFYHAHASHRLTKNQIKALEIDGVRCTRHVDKAKILDNHFSGLVGAPITPVWDFDLAEVYNSVVADPAPLVASFSSAEALAAVKNMNFTSAPGPDGFGPGFYRLHQGGHYLTELCLCHRTGPVLSQAKSSHPSAEAGLCQIVR